MDTNYTLFLFVNAANRAQASAQVESLLKVMPAELYQLECINIDEAPERAKEYSIQNTPALVIQRSGPGPGMNRNIFYSFDEDYQILYALGRRRLW